MAAAALLGIGSSLSGEVGLQLLLSPLGCLSPLSSNIVIRTTCCSVGIALPVYSTYKAIESKDQNEQHRMLIYWAAFGSFSLVEVLTDKLISWFPMYYHIKFAFLVWLQLPSTDGAKQLYMNHLRPFLRRHQARVDQITGVAYGELAKLVSQHQSEIEFARIQATRVVSSVQQLMRGETASHAPGGQGVTAGETAPPAVGGHAITEGETRHGIVESETTPPADTESDREDRDI